MEAVLAALPELDRRRERAGTRPRTAAAAPRVVAEPRHGLARSSASSSARLGTTLDCGDAQAAIWLPRGRVAKYAADSSSESRSTDPLDAYLAVERLPQWKTSAAWGFAASSVALRLSWFV